MVPSFVKDGGKKTGSNERRGQHPVSNRVLTREFNLLLKSLDFKPTKPFFCSIYFGTYLVFNLSTYLNTYLAPTL